MYKLIVMDIRKKCGFFNLVAILVLTFFMCFSTVFTYANTDEDITDEQYSTEAQNVPGIIVDSIDSIETEVILHENNVYKYTEVIKVTLDEDNSCYVRTLPKEYIGRISNVNVKGYDFYFDENKGTISINIKKKGTKAFEISYDVEGTNNLGEKKDNFKIYFLNGTECPKDKALEKANFILTYSKNVKWDSWSFEQGSMKGELIAPDDKNVVEFHSDKDQEVGNVSPMWISAEFPKGFWSNASDIGWTKNISITLFVLGIIIFIVMRIALGREKDIIITKTPYPPYEMTPMQVGYLVDGYVDNRDIIAQILYLAEEEYLKIREYEKFQFEFEYLRYPDKEDQGTKLLFNAIFAESDHPGSKVRLCDASDRVRRILHLVRKKTARLFRGGRAAFTTGSKFGNSFVRLIYFVIVATLPLMNFSYTIATDNDLEVGILASLSSALILTFLLSRVCISYMKLHRKQVDGNKLYFRIWTGLYVVASVIYVYLFRFAIDGRVGDIQVTLVSAVFLTVAPLMLFGFRARGAKAADVYGSVQGFIEYIKETKGDELQQVAGDDGRYFFKILPYSYMFGVSMRVASNFQDISVPAPFWYLPFGCNENYVFDVVVMNAMLRNFEAGMMNEIFSVESNNLTTKEQ